MKFSVLGFRSDIRIKLRAHVVNPGRFAPDPVCPLDVSTSVVSPLVVSPPLSFCPPPVLLPLIDSPQEEKSTYFAEIYMNS